MHTVRMSFRILIQYALPLFILCIVSGSVLWMYRQSMQNERVDYVNVTLTPMTTNNTAQTFAITSPAFADGESIPAAYTCDDSREVSPPLSFTGVPNEARSLALVMDDPDIPKALYPNGGEFDHWILFNIPPSTTDIREGSSVGIAGANSAGNNTYYSPCPPSQYEPSEHRYIFTLYALDTILNLNAGASKSEVLAAMQGHVIAQTQLIGKYQRK